jgi:hypothetical protein
MFSKILKKLYQDKTIMEIQISFGLLSLLILKLNIKVSKDYA